MDKLILIAVGLLTLTVLVHSFAPGALAFLTPEPDLPDDGASVSELVDSGQAQLLDVRTADEFDDNGLHGAKNIPVQQLSARIDDVGAKDKPVVLYCRSGNRSARAKNILEEHDYAEVYDLGARSTARRILDASDSNLEQVPLSTGTPTTN